MYVSFYKILGGIASMALLGPADLLAKAWVWQRRQGGNLARLFPYLRAACKGMGDHLHRIPAYVTHALAVATALQKIPELRVLPGPPPTNMFHLFIEVATEMGAWLFHPPRPGRGQRCTATTLVPELQNAEQQKS